MKYLRKLVGVALILFGLIFPMCNINAEIDYDVEYTDKSDDVQKLEDDGMSNVTGHENIDILTATSSKQPIALNILLEMTVAGEIQKSEQASYNFMIMDAQEMVYMVTYQNGTCMGMSMSDSSSEEYTEPDILVATGAGTDTLRVTLPIDKLGGITEFIFSGAAMESEFGDDYFYMYVDQVPDDAFPFAGGNGDINGNGDDNGDYWYDMPVRINEPKDGATIFKECEIKGTINSWEYTIVTVEVQIDSTSSSGWEKAKTNDGWETWSYDWDTEKTSDGKHEINVRADSDEGYQYDSITVYVNQQLASSPPSANGPVFQKGDKYEYKLIYETENEDLPPGGSITGGMSIEILGTDTITVDGTDFEVYILKIHGLHKMDYGMGSATYTMDGKVWLQQSDLATVKEDTTTESSYIGFGEDSKETYHEIVTYDPPDDKYGLPITVTEKWESTTYKVIEGTENIDGETDTYSDSETVITRSECLRTNTVSVTAGTFDVFVVHVTTEYSWDDDDYEDSDNDGWYDWEEEEYGTDPEDPEDYPEYDDEDYEDTDGDGWYDWEEEEYGTDPEDPEDYPEDYYDDDDYEDTDGDGWYDWEEEEYGTDPEDPEDYPEDYYEDDGEYSGDLSEEYTLEYYSPEIGYMVKMESYDQNRQLIMTFELISYNYGNKGTQPSTGSEGISGSEYPKVAGMEMPVFFLILLIIIILILFGIVIVIKRNRYKRAGFSNLHGRQHDQAYQSPQAPERSAEEVKFETVDDSDHSNHADKNS